MAFTVSVGEADFAALRNENAYYVDKTDIIYELVHETNNKVTLFTRPRRFGKTLMMSMMENFFNIRKDCKGLFENLEISKHVSFCKEWMNQYPVLFISFKDVEAEDFEDAYRMLESRLADVCKDFADITDNSAINPADKEIFRRLMYGSAKNNEVKNSIKTLMRMLNAVYGKKVILLIDEYDVPLAKANEKNTTSNNYYSKMLDVIKGIMSTSLKDNELLKFAVVTGCIQIAK